MKNIRIIFLSILLSILLVDNKLYCMSIPLEVLVLHLEEGPNLALNFIAIDLINKNPKEDLQNLSSAELEKLKEIICNGSILIKQLPKDHNISSGNDEYISLLDKNLDYRHVTSDERYELIFKFRSSIFSIIKDRTNEFYRLHEDDRRAEDINYILYHRNEDIEYVLTLSDNFTIVWDLKSISKLCKIVTNPKSKIYPSKCGKFLINNERGYIIDLETLIEINDLIEYKKENEHLEHSRRKKFAELVNFLASLIAR